MRILNLNKIKKALEGDPRLTFAYIFGSSKYGNIDDKSDFDIAIYLNCSPSFEVITDIFKLIEKIVSHIKVDLVILNNCKNIILKYEVIMGNLIFSRDDAFLAGYFSLAMREYEDELVRLERCRKYRRNAAVNK